MEAKEKQIAFCQRVNNIYMKLTGDYNKDDHYFDSCSFYPAGTLFLDAYAYLSDMIESSFIFVKAPEGSSYWDRIVGQLREEI